MPVQRVVDRPAVSPFAAGAAGDGSFEVEPQVLGMLRSNGSPVEESALQVECRNFFEEVRHALPH